MPSEMSATPLPVLTLYTRAGCELCDEAREIIEGLLEDRAARGQPLVGVREVDIAADPALERRFFDVIPVIELRGRRLELVTSAAKVRRLLADALDNVA
jgi:hypothetical protein